MAVVTPRKSRVLVGVLVGCILGFPAAAAADYSVAMGRYHALALNSDGSIWAWGHNGSGQLGDGTYQGRRIPGSVNWAWVATRVAAGTYHSLALRNDGTVWAWGSNSSGQLGDGTTTGRSLPVQVGGGLSNVVAIAAGDAHSLALKADGTLWAWGHNVYGQIGDGTQTTRTTPVQVVALSDDVAGIAADLYRSMAVKTDGTVWNWGINIAGTAGNGTTASPKLTPTQATTNVVLAGVSTGENQAFAWDVSGSLYAWGTGSTGQLGTGTTISLQSTPLLISTIDNISAIQGGTVHTLALRGDGTVWAWGTNAFGQVGDGTTATRLGPVSIAGPTDVVAVAARGESSIAVSSDGRIWTWGNNAQGQLGDGTTRHRFSPVQISDAGFEWRVATPHFSVDGGNYMSPLTVTITDAAPGAAIHYTTNGQDPTQADPAIASGSSVAVVETTTVKAKAWLGGMPPSNIAAETYTLVVPNPLLSAGSGTYASALSVTVSGPVAGTVFRYTLDGTTPTQSSPSYSSALAINTATTFKVVGFKTGWSPSSVVTATYSFNYGTLAAPTLAPAPGEVGYQTEVTLSAAAGATIRYTTNGSTPDASSPPYTTPLVLAGTMTVKARAFHPDWTTSPITTGAYTIKVATTALSPGSGTYSAGQVITVTNSTPGAVIRYTTNGLDPTESDPSIASGGTLVAGNYVLKARAFRTGWTSSDITTATYTMTGDFTAPSASGGANSSVLLKPDGTVWTWGDNYYGQLGNGTTVARLMPGSVTGLTGVTAVAAGSNHVLALRSNGTVWAWGSNGFGQLGDGSTINRLFPVPIAGLSNVTAIAAGGNASAALKADGTLWMWGANYNGQLGDGTIVNKLTPIQVALTSVQTIVVGDRHTLASRSDGTIWSWGGNSSRQLGDGTGTDRLSPVQASWPPSAGSAVATGHYHSFGLTSGGVASAWGSNGQGALGLGVGAGWLSTPTVLTGIDTLAQLTGGATHSVARRADGTAWAWGGNASGQLGDGTLTARNVPGEVPGLANAVVVGVGANHSLAITADGTVWTWGLNSQGQLGDGTTDMRMSPVPISEPGFGWKTSTPRFSPAGGTFSATVNVTVTTITAGATTRYTTNGNDPTVTDAQVPPGGIIAITESATLKARSWAPGQPASNVATGVFVLQVPTPSLSVSSGTYFAAQSVVVSNAIGGVTMRYTTDGSTPVSTSPVVAAGSAISIDVSSLLKVKAWKSGWADSDVRSATYVLQVPAPTLTPAAGILSGVANVSMATANVVADIRYTVDGTGPSVASSLYGGPVTVDRSLTIRAVGFKNGWTPSTTTVSSYSISHGATSAPAIAPLSGTYAEPVLVRVTSDDPNVTIRFTLDGSEPTWQSPRYSSAIVISTTTTLKAKAFRADHGPSATASATYALDPSGAVATPTLVPGAGEYTTSQVIAVSTPTAGASLHYTTDGSEPTPADPIVSAGVVVVDRSMRLSVRAFKDGLDASPIRHADYLITGIVVAGARSSYVVKSDGTVWAWGNNSTGQLGDGTTVGRTTPALVPGISNVVALSASRTNTGHVVAVKRDGTVWAWGANGLGQLGVGDQTVRYVPVQVAGLSNIVAVAAGTDHSLALDRNGSVWAWGSNSYGVLGDGTTTRRLTPVPVPSLRGISAIAAGGQQSLALQDDGTGAGLLWAWGRNDRGQLGDGTTIDRVSPVVVPDLVSVVDLRAGWLTSRAVTADGRAWAWGMNSDAQIGDGTQWTDRLRPVPLAWLDSPAVWSDGGFDFGGALTRDGAVWTWGFYTLGQLGSGQAPQRSLPDRALLGASMALAFGDHHGLSIDVGGSLWAWGDSGSGQVGTGTTAPVWTPLALSGMTVVNNAWLSTDSDADGLLTWVELRQGTDPYDSDSNDDGILDALSGHLSIEGANVDLDDDGISNARELQLGTDPFATDSDGDGVRDDADAFPLDPGRSAWPTPQAGDTTPPVVTLIEPTNAVLVP